MRPSSPYRPTFNPFSTDSPPPSSSRYAAPPTLTRSAPESTMYRVFNVPYQEPSTEHQQRPLDMQSNDCGLWTYNPVFGIVHSPPDGCSICNTYVDHMMVAMNISDASFVQAVDARKESQDTFFMDGFSEGMRHQRYNDLQLNEDIEHLRTKLDLAMSAIKESEAENERLRKELDRARQQTTNSEESQYLKIPFSPMDSLPSRSSPSTSGALGTGSRGSSSGSSMELQRHISQDANLSSPWFSGITEPREVHTIYTISSLNDRQQNQVDSPAKQSLPSYALAVSNHLPSIFASHTAPHLPMKPHPVTKVPPSRVEPHSPMTSRSQHDKSKARYPKTMKELKDLVDLAHEPTSDGVAALSIVKSFCSRAHSTPREHKSLMQRWILMNWKNPYATGSTTSTPTTDAKPNPRIDDPVNTWYEYLCAHPHSWPKGVRKDLFNRPVMSDLIANRAVARMKPTEPAASRNDFVAHVTDMFAIPGMYKRLLEMNNLTVAPEMSYKLFTGPINIDAIVRHFAESGVTPAEAVKNFEPWAKHYKEC